MNKKSLYTLVLMLPLGLLSFDTAAQVVNPTNPQVGYMSVYNEIVGHPGPNHGLCTALAETGTLIFEAGNPIPALLPIAETCLCYGFGVELPWYVVAGIPSTGTPIDECFSED